MSRSNGLQVLECLPARARLKLQFCFPSPLALFHLTHAGESGRGLPQSKTLSRRASARCGSRCRRALERASPLRAGTARGPNLFGS
jgi:hypothetical protein